MTAEVMMKEYKNMKKELTVTEFQLRQFQGVSEQDMIDSMLYCFYHCILCSILFLDCPEDIFIDCSFCHQMLYDNRVFLPLSVKSGIQLLIQFEGPCKREPYNG